MATMSPSWLAPGSFYSSFLVRYHSVTTTHYFYGTRNGDGPSFTADTSYCWYDHSEDLIISIFITIKKLSQENFSLNYMGWSIVFLWFLLPSFLFSLLSPFVKENFHIYNTVTAWIPPSQARMQCLWLSHQLYRWFNKPSWFLEK